jgi:hypothetical protein
VANQLGQVWKLQEKDRELPRKKLALRCPASDRLGMCNLYIITKSQDAIRQLVKYSRDMTGNLPPLSAEFSNKMAPVVRTAPDGARELLMMRWGFSPPIVPGSKPRNPYLTTFATPTPGIGGPISTSPAIAA